MASLKFKPAGSVLREFMRDQSFVRGIRGPVGSGKSAGCCIEIFRRAGEQKPHTDGIRYTKWAVIRNTNPELKTTTIATWLDWFPEEDWGKFTWSVPYTHKIVKGDVELEVIFLALDRPEDVKKFGTKKDIKLGVTQSDPTLTAIQGEIDILNDEIFLMEGLDKTITELIAAFKRELTRRENELRTRALRVQSHHKRLTLNLPVHFRDNVPHHIGAMVVLAFGFVLVDAAYG